MKKLYLYLGILTGRPASLYKGEREPVRPLVDLVPPEMEAITLNETVWKGWFYSQEFRKPGCASEGLQ